MMRVIVTPPVLPAAALAELKQWLGVTTSGDDAELGTLLRAALDVCTDYIGIMPLALACEETWPARGDCVVLTSRPVTSLVEVAMLAADGTRTTLDASGYRWWIGADGAGHLRLTSPGVVIDHACRVVVRFQAGLADDWDALPQAIHHGLIRLAAHQYRAREGRDAEVAVPASVVALWRPWRRMRIA